MVEAENEMTAGEGIEGRGKWREWQEKKWEKKKYLVRKGEKCGGGC